ncbi:MAG TPA: Bax inhibitor-1 family protein [Chthonomonadales bacterium]|nr:Bax inhibitor-1 family protein [Chthonomonadales bacterium]
MNYGMTAPYGTLAGASMDVRAAFIRKTYSLFFLSLCVTIAAGWFVIASGAWRAVLAVWPILLIAEFVLVMVLGFSRRTTGLNTALLYLFAAVQGAIFGPILMMLSQTAPGVAPEAAMLTMIVFGGLTLYAMQSGRDFSYMGGFLFIAVIGLVVAGLLLLFFHWPLLYMAYTVGGVLIFSGFVLYDTSMIMKRLSPGDEIAGAISLYLDFINLFWFILQLLLEFSGNSRD